MGNKIARIHSVHNLTPKLNLIKYNKILGRFKLKKKLIKGLDRDNDETHTR